MMPLVDMAMQQIAAGDLAAAENIIQVLEDQITDKEDPKQRAEVLKLHGRVCMRQHDWVSAFDYISAAMGQQPDDIDGHLLMGMVTFELGDFPMAAESFREVIARNGWAHKAWLKLGGCHALMQCHAEAWACLERALGLMPDDPECHHAMAIMCSSLGVEEGALHHFREARRLKPDYAFAEAGEAFTLLRMGRWSEAWPLFEARWRIPAPVSPWWYEGRALYTGDLEGLRGKRVLLRSEQGFGDSIHFARYVAPLTAIADEVLIETQSELERLFQTLPAKVSVRVRDPIPAFDVQTSLMSLPLLFDTVPERVPPPAWFATTPRFTHPVGVCWAGGARPEDPMANAVDQRRSMTKAQMLPVLSVLEPVLEPVQTVLNSAPAELRYGYQSLQVEALKALGVKDWQDTADIIAGLSLVITVDTAIAHLAASLGVETWMLSRFDSCWRWGLTSTDTPWYPTMRIFRQPRLGAWGPVIADVVSALKERQL